MASRRRSISDIVAVIMLIIIAIAAAAIIYAWLSGFIGGVRSSSGSVTAVKLEITGVSNSSGELAIYMLNPLGSSPTSVSQVILEFTNGTVIATASFPTPFTIGPNSAKSITMSTNGNFFFNTTAFTNVPAGIPVEVIIYTTSGYSTSYTFTWGGSS